MPYPQKNGSPDLEDIANQTLNGLIPIHSENTSRQHHCRLQAAAGYSVSRPVHACQAEASIAAANARSTP